MTRIIEERCSGCGICANICPEGIEMKNNMAIIKNEKADCLKEAASSCSKNAILIEGESVSDGEKINQSLGWGMGIGRGKGKGMGKGMGMGPRDGRGMGRRRGN